MWRPTIKCPVCGTVMPWKRFRARAPWVCPGCSGKFQIQRSRANVLNMCAVGLALGVSYTFGVRDLTLLVATVALWFPALLVCIFVADRLIPQRLEVYRSERAG